jgi:hypothetical protein
MYDPVPADWEKRFIPQWQTALRWANCEYLLKMIDVANFGMTTYGTGVYATRQVVDGVAVAKAVSTLVRPLGPGFLAFRISPVTYYVDLHYSSDGASWVTFYLPANMSFQSIAYGNGVCMIVGQGSGSNVAFCSLDIVHWKEYSYNGASRYVWGSVVFGAGKFVVVGRAPVSTQKQSCVSYSTDGVSWVDGSLPSAEYSWSVAYGNGRFVVLGRAYLAYTNKAAYSVDGVNWTETVMPVSIAWGGVKFCGGMFFAFGDYSKGSYTYNYVGFCSTDGVDWVEISLPGYGGMSHGLGNVVYGNGRFVLIGWHNSRYKLFSSGDGVNWTEVFIPGYDKSGSYFDSVAYGNGRFVLLGVIDFFGEVLYSSDGLKWVKEELRSYFPATASLSGLFFVGG